MLANPTRCPNHPTQAGDGSCTDCPPNPEDAACAGCYTASIEHPCLGHGCTAWCRRHYDAAMLATRRPRVMKTTTTKTTIVDSPRGVLTFLFRPAGGHSFYRGLDGRVYLRAGDDPEVFTLDTTKPVSIGGLNSGFLLPLVEGGCTVADAVEAVKVIETFGLKLRVGDRIFAPEVK